MQKIYGYKEADIKGLISFMKEQKNKSLTSVFTEYARANGKASGTIRNLYYAIVKKSNEDQSFCNKYLGGEKLTVVKKESFDEKEEIDLVKSILREKAKGKSVRRAINELASGDEKKALRYQNKYRLVLKKAPDKLSEIARELKEKEGVKIEPWTIDKKTLDFGYLRLKREIDKLVNGIAEREKKENEYLRSRVAILENENLKLNSMLLGSNPRSSRLSAYFNKSRLKKTSD